MRRSTAPARVAGVRSQGSLGRGARLAGPERSGSTWLFNAVRLLYEDAREPLDAFWITRLTDAALDERGCGAGPALKQKRLPAWQVHSLGPPRKGRPHCSYNRRLAPGRRLGACRSRRTAILQGAVRAASLPPRQPAYTADRPPGPRCRGAGRPAGAAARAREDARLERRVARRARGARAAHAPRPAGRGGQLPAHGLGRRPEVRLRRGPPALAGAPCLGYIP